MFKSCHIIGRDISEVWFKLLYEIYYNGRKNKIDSGSFEKETYRLEFDFVSGTIEQPISYTEGNIRLPLAVEVPQGVPAPNSEQEIEDYFVNYIMNSDLTPQEHYRYSTWIVGGEYSIPNIHLIKHEFEGNVGVEKEKIQKLIGTETTNLKVFTPNQLHWCIKHFKEKGYGTNHCYIQVGYPESNNAYDLKYSVDMERGTSPCLRGLDFKIVQENNINYLLTTCYFRSWDLYAGFPTNMGGIALLTEYICQELGDVKPGPISFASKGLHCYGFQFEALKARLGIKE